MPQPGQLYGSFCCSLLGSFGPITLSFEHELIVVTVTATAMAWSKGLVSFMAVYFRIES